jgi:hypothetical protein
MYLEIFGGTSWGCYNAFRRWWNKFPTDKALQLAELVYGEESCIGRCLEEFFRFIRFCKPNAKRIAFRNQVWLHTHCAQSCAAESIAKVKNSVSETAVGGNWLPWKGAWICIWRLWRKLKQPEIGSSKPASAMAPSDLNSVTRYQWRIGNYVPPRELMADFALSSQVRRHFLATEFSESWSLVR